MREKLFKRKGGKKKAKFIKKRELSALSS